MAATCNWQIGSMDCTLETCCLAQSSFLYRPSFGGNLLFAICFAVFILPQLWLGIRYKIWGYMIGMIIGLAFEVVGYGARVGLYYNPFDNNWFLLYLIFITIAPVFMTASIYLCLSRIVVLYGEHLSFFRPRTLALVFMTSDFFSLVLQAAGGAIAETATQNNDNPQTGTDIMIAGLLLQAVSLGFFLLIWAIFTFQVRRGITDQTYWKAAIRRRALFHAFSAGLLLATILILTRSIYRVIELWGGFSGSVWNDEVDFMVLDGAMISLAVVLLTALHPGPAFAGRWDAVGWRMKEKKTTKTLSSNSSAYEVPQHQPATELLQRNV